MNFQGSFVLLLLKMHFSHISLNSMCDNPSAPYILSLLLFESIA